MIKLSKSKVYASFLINGCLSKLLEKTLEILFLRVVPMDGLTTQQNNNFCGRA